MSSLRSPSSFKRTSSSWSFSSCSFSESSARCTFLLLNCCLASSIFFWRSAFLFLYLLILSMFSGETFSLRSCWTSPSIRSTSFILDKWDRFISASFSLIWRETSSASACCALILAILFFHSWGKLSIKISVSTWSSCSWFSRYSSSFFKFSLSSSRIFCSSSNCSISLETALSSFLVPKSTSCSIRSLVSCLSLSFDSMASLQLINVSSRRFIFSASFNNKACWIMISCSIFSRAARSFCLLSLSLSFFFWSSFNFFMRVFISLDSWLSRYFPSFLMRSSSFSAFLHSSCSSCSISFWCLLFSVSWSFCSFLSLFNLALVSFSIIFSWIFPSFFNCSISLTASLSWSCSIFSISFNFCSASCSYFFISALICFNLSAISFFSFFACSSSSFFIENVSFSAIFCCSFCNFSISLAFIFISLSAFDCSSFIFLIWSLASLAAFFSFTFPENWSFSNSLAAILACSFSIFSISLARSLTSLSLAFWMSFISSTLNLAWRSSAFSWSLSSLRTRSRSLAACFCWSFSSSVISLSLILASLSSCFCCILISSNLSLFSRWSFLSSNLFCFSLNAFSFSSFFSWTFMSSEISFCLFLASLSSSSCTSFALLKRSLSLFSWFFLADNSSFFIRSCSFFNIPFPFFNSSCFFFSSLACSFSKVLCCLSLSFHSLATIFSCVFKSLVLLSISFSCCLSLALISASFLVCSLSAPFSKRVSSFLR